MEMHSSLRPLYEYEANYVNASGYCCVFHETALNLRDEALAADETAKALLLDVWGRVGVRYSLRTLGLRAEFYKRSARDPVHARLVMPVLEGRSDVPAADDLDDVLKKLEIQMSAQLMKAAASLHATNAVKKGAGGAGAVAQ
jgi:hypothetical protein